MRRISMALLSTLLLLIGIAVPTSAQGDRDCQHFATQEEAQAVLDVDPQSRDALDSGGHELVLLSSPMILFG